MEEDKRPGLSKLTVGGAIILAILIVLVFSKGNSSLVGKNPAVSNASAATAGSAQLPKPQRILPDPNLEILTDEIPVKTTAEKTSEAIYQEAGYAVKLLITVKTANLAPFSADGSATDYQIEIGSGIVVKSAQPNFCVLTAEHLIILRPGDKVIAINAYFKDGTPPQKMEIVGAGQKYDALLLKFKNSNFLPKTCAKIGKSKLLNPGSMITGIGSNAGGDFWCSANNYLFVKPGDPGPAIHEILKKYKWPTMMLLNMSIFHGYSGGALLNARGELVGIMVGMFNVENQTIGIGLPIDDVLKDFKNGLIAPNP